MFVGELGDERLVVKGFVELFVFPWVFGRVQARAFNSAQRLYWLACSITHARQASLQIFHSRRGDSTRPGIQLPPQ